MKAPSLFFFIILANFVIHHEHKISMNMYVFAGRMIQM